MVRNHEEPAVGGPRIRLGDGARKLGDGARARIAAEQERQHRHEVTLAASEASVQVGALARVLSDCAPDQRQRALEAAHKLWSHHVVLQGPVGVLHPLRQPQDVVSLVDAFGEIEDLGDGRHGDGAPVECSSTLLFQNLGIVSSKLRRRKTEPMQKLIDSLRSPEERLLHNQFCKKSPDVFD